MELAFDLYESAELIMRENLRRRFPEADDDEIERRLLDWLQKRPGAGIVPAPGQPHYTAAKHGVLGLTKCAAAEYVTQGIRANAICPGLTDTRMVREFLAASPPGVADAVRRTVPGGELGKPEHVAALAVWLCSEQAVWVNGQGIVVDGGGVMR